MTIQYCESRIREMLLFRVVEVQRTCEATATPLFLAEGANLSELLFTHEDIYRWIDMMEIVRTIRGFDYQATNHFRLFYRVSGFLCTRARRARRLPMSGV